MAEASAGVEISGTRRQFIRWSFWAAAALVTAEIGAASLVFFMPKLKLGAFGSVVSVGPLEGVLEDLPDEEADPLYFRESRFYLTHVEDGLLALYRKCPHLGCVVPWNDPEDQFHCPCHSSLYNRKGEVLGGPAPRPMDLMAMRLDEDGNVLVDTGTITERSVYSPDQALPV